VQQTLQALQRQRQPWSIEFPPTRLAMMVTWHLHMTDV
jgi:hypothetical protein